ncbi:MAG TPA: hypothetical protein EYG11_18690 [Candidatus Latescibacteria bacterium]|nr:hypothetical protein [Candidatus Latescibacterota bacterium]
MVTSWCGDNTVESICREHNISKASFHRWRRKYSDMDLADAQRLKELKKMLAETPGEPVSLIMDQACKVPKFLLSRYFLCILARG